MYILKTDNNLDDIKPLNAKVENIQSWWQKVILDY